MLYLIGLGLGDCKDITLKGLEAIKNSKYVYLEYYTSINRCSIKEMESLYGKKIILADRDLIENKIENEILNKAINNNVSILIIGDPLSATTHIDIILRAKERKIKTKVIHNASIITAVGISGLEIYKFGKITSIPFNNQNITTPVDVLKKNQSIGLHTLFLFDLDPINNRFMNISEAIQYLLNKGVNEELLAIGCASLGTDDSFIVSGKLKELKEITIEKYPQCLIIPGELHFIEEEYLENINIKNLKK